MRCLRIILAIAGLLFITSRFVAQTPQVAPRVLGPVNEKSLVVLSGNVPSIARSEFDRGAAPASAQMSRVRLVLARSQAQQAALDKYDAELLDKSSPNYHKWLTPQQFGKLYGPADSDIAAVVAWLESHGLQVDPVFPSRVDISFSGSVLDIEQLLNVTMHSFDANGEQFLANVNDPSLPAALAPVVSGVYGLNTMRPKPQHVLGQMGLYNPSSSRMEAAAQAASRGPRADLTIGTSPNFSLFLVPGDAATIYDTPNTVLNANFPSGTSYTGTGITIGVGGDATVNAGTVQSYRQRFISATDNNPPTISYCGAYVDGGFPTCSGSSAGLGIGTADQDEAYLDMEISGGLAPAANIHYYASSDLVGAIEAALHENTVDIFSLSFGYCELDLATGGNQLINSWWQQAATQGIAVTVSTGDNGSAGCDNNNTQQTANVGLQVSGYATTPYNVAVGGTDFGPLLTSFSTYAGDTNSNAAATLYRTAKSYIPEWTWNDSTTVNTTLSANVPFINSGKGNIVAASGGKSACSTNTTTYNGNTETRGTCTSGYPKPTWQRGTGVPSDSARDIPDISLMAGAGGDAAAWLVCTDDTGQVGTPPITVTANCTTQSDNKFYFFGFGGTSTAAPAVAGILALVQDKLHTASGGSVSSVRLGQAAKELYDLYNGSHASAIFHDVTIGNISVPCDSGSTNCSKNTAGNFFLTGYDTTAGYDLATGMGSLDVAQLINFWGTSAGGATTTVTVSPSATSIARTAPLTVGVTVKGNSTTGNPTGQVTLAGAGLSSSFAAQTLTNSGTDSGTVSFSIPANTLTRGVNQTLTATYAGDANYANQTGTATISVTGVTPTVTVAPNSHTLNSADSLIVTATVAGAAGTPTGTVTLTGGGYNSGAQNLDSNGKFTFTISPFSFTAGAVTLTVNYSGDATYDAASNTASVTVTASTFTLSATNVTLTAGATTGNTSTVTVTPVAGYTGTVNLTAAVTSSPSGAVSAPTLTGSSVTITNATPKTGTVTVATTPASAAVRGSGPISLWYRAAGGTVFAAFLLFFLPVGFRRGRKVLSAVLVLVAVTFTAVGCGSSHTLSTPSITVTPSKTTFSAATAISVNVSVSGGAQTATGSVSLSGGGFNGSGSLSSGSAIINIPANSLTPGSVTLTASYAGDSNYASGNGSATVTVNKAGTTPGAYTVTVTGTDSAHANITSTTTFTLTVN